MTKNELIALAAENEVEIDPTSKKAVIEEALTAAGVELPADDQGKDEPTVTCVILRDIWVEEDDRRHKGEEIELGIDEALEMIESGVVTRKK